MNRTSLFERDELRLERTEEVRLTARAVELRFELRLADGRQSIELDLPRRLLGASALLCSFFEASFEELRDPRWVVGDNLFWMAMNLFPIEDLDLALDEPTLADAARDAVRSALRGPRPARFEAHVVQRAHDLGLAPSLFHLAAADAVLLSWPPPEDDAAIDAIYDADRGLVSVVQWKEVGDGLDLEEALALDPTCEVGDALGVALAEVEPVLGPCTEQTLTILVNEVPFIFSTEGLRAELS